MLQPYEIFICTQICTWFMSLHMSPTNRQATKLHATVGSKLINLLNLLLHFRYIH